MTKPIASSLLYFSSLSSTVFITICVCVFSCLQFKYKQAYEKAKGKHIGFRSLEDDPKLVHFMQVAKMQSDREYRKGYEKSKTSFHTPVDMFSVVAAKKSQEVATNTNYRNVIHTYNMLPDAMNFELAKNMMQIQSDVRGSHTTCRAFTLETKQISNDHK